MKQSVLTKFMPQILGTKTILFWQHHFNALLIEDTVVSNDAWFYKTQAVTQVHRGTQNKWTCSNYKVAARTDEPEVLGDLVM